MYNVTCPIFPSSWSFFEEKCVRITQFGKHESVILQEQGTA